RRVHRWRENAVLLPFVIREPIYGSDASIDPQTTRVGMNTAKKSTEVVLTTPVWVAGVALRAIFLVILMVITMRVSSPQVEQLSSLFKTPDELIRVALGFAVCVWLFIHLFILPKDPGA